MCNKIKERERLEADENNKMCTMMMVQNLRSLCKPDIGATINSKLTNFWPTHWTLSSRNLKSGMLSVYLISMTVFVDDFDDATDDDVSSSSDGLDPKRTTANLESLCLKLTQWFWVRLTLVISLFWFEDTCSKPRGVVSLLLLWFESHVMGR